MTGSINSEYGKNLISKQNPLTMNSTDLGSNTFMKDSHMQTRRPTNMEELRYIIGMMADKTRTSQVWKIISQQQQSQSLTNFESEVYFYRITQAYTM